MLNKVILLSASSLVLTSCSSTDIAEFKKIMGKSIAEAQCRERGSRSSCERVGITGIEYEYVLEDIKIRKESERRSRAAAAGLEHARKVKSQL
jgi:uncharacterized OsmC-like protein